MTLYHTPGEPGARKCDQELCRWITETGRLNEEAVWNALLPPVTILQGDRREQVSARARPDINCTDYTGVVQFLKNPDLKSLKQRHLKKLTILHSNDLHGDFLAESINAELVGGVSMLSGYIQKVKQEEKNVVYVIAGDMLRGSIIDTEYKGLSTIEIMNLLSPDVATIGNHEVDYGLAHLLFIEKCANFPIINANLYLTCNDKRLFSSHYILEIDGIRILFYRRAHGRGTAVHETGGADRKAH